MKKKVLLNGDIDYQQLLKKDRKGFLVRFLNAEKWLNRPLAALLVRPLFRTAITPNQLTVVAFALGMLGAGLFALGTAKAVFWAAVLCELSLTFDCADGMLARARNSCSRFGSFFDLFLDRITDFCVYLGITIGYYRAGNNNKDRLILGLFVISLYMLQVTLFYISNRFFDKSSGESGEARALGVLVISILGMLNRLDVIIYILLIEAVLNLIYRVSHFLLSGPKAEQP